jgi:hypothetical protein
VLRGDAKLLARATQPPVQDTERDHDDAILLAVRFPVCLLVYFSADRSAHEVLRGDAKLLAPEETPEEVIREREQRAAQLVSVQDKLKAAAAGALGAG